MRDGAADAGARVPTNDINDTSHANDSGNGIDPHAGKYHQQQGTGAPQANFKISHLLAPHITRNHHFFFFSC